MNTDGRVKRPDPERTNPIRDWSTLFEPPRGADEPPGPARDGARLGSVDDVIARSVELGYRLVDEYMRQGERTARRFGERSYSPQTFVSDAQDLGARMAQYASDFVRLWVELVQLAASGGLPAQRVRSNDDRTFAGGAVAPAAADPPRDARVVIEIASSQPTESCLDLRPEAAERPIVVHALRAVDPDKPRITEVEFQPARDGEPARLRIGIPPGLPPGVYSGLLVDEENSRPMGSLTIRV